MVARIMHSPRPNSVIALTVTLFIFKINLIVAQDSLCTTFDEYNSTCQNPAVWAVNLPNLTLTHNYLSPTVPPYNIQYMLGSSLLCTFAITSGDACRIADGSNCGTCINSYTTNQRAVNSFIVNDLNSAKNGSIVTYSIASEGITEDLVELSLLECPRNWSNAIAQTTPDPCGYECETTFSCEKEFGMQHSDEGRIFTCSATATWTPSLEGVCTATSPEITTPDPSAEDTNDTQGCDGPCVSYQENGEVRVKCQDQTYNKKSSPAEGMNGNITSKIELYCLGFTGGYIAGIVLATIGGLATVACVVADFKLWLKLQDNDSQLKFILPQGLFFCLWAIDIGLLFGLGDGAYAMTPGQITGCVLGTIATVGLIVSCVVMVVTKGGSKG